MQRQQRKTGWNWTLKLVQHAHAYCCVDSWLDIWKARSRLDAFLILSEDHAVRTSCTIASRLTLRPVIERPGQILFSRSRCHTLPTLLLYSGHISRAARATGHLLSTSDSGRTVSIGTCIHETQRSLLSRDSRQRQHAPCNVMRNFTNKGFCCDCLRRCYPKPLGIPAWGWLVV